MDPKWNKPGRALLCLFTLSWFLAPEIQGQTNTSCAPVPEGIISWWTAEDNTLDNVGVNNGIAGGALTYAVGKVGKAFSLDGASSFIRIPASTSLDVGQGNGLTIEAWVMSRVTSAAPVFDWSADGAYGVFLWLSQSAPGTVYVDVADAGGADYVYETAVGLVSANSWHHVALTYDKVAGWVRIYVDGQIALERAAPAFTPHTSEDLFIGKRAPTAPYGGVYFNGLIDEPSIYDRALGTNEIQAIYSAGSSGKCSTPTPPFIFTQPQNQTIYPAFSATFSIMAGGTAPLSFQWRKDSIAIRGASSSLYAITNAQLSDAGNYSVAVSNAFGYAISSDAVLTVNSALPCAPPPSGLSAWWRAELDATDTASTNNGTLINNVTFGPGLAGQTFLFNGINQFVQVPDSPSLDPADAMTLEGWVRVDAYPSIDTVSIVTKENQPTGPQYQLALVSNAGRWCFRALISLPGWNANFCGATSVQVGTWYHFALTYDGEFLRLYVNGNPDGSLAARGRIVTGGESLTIGCERAAWFFNGAVDELSLYSRSLSTSEIEAIYAAGAGGKCVNPVPPFIYVQPGSQTVDPGNDATFFAVAGGTQPLMYQWQREGVTLQGASGSSLTLTNIQTGDAGAYSVVITNGSGAVTSSNGMLTVTPAPPCTNAASGLVSWWQAQGDALDTVGGNNGILINAPEFMPGEVGKAFNFNGVDQLIQVSDAAGLDPASALTLEGWVKIVGYPGPGVASIVTKDNNWGAQYQLALMNNNGGWRFRTLIMVSSVGYASVVGNTTANAGTWHHLATTYDGAFLKLYVDGSLDGSVPVSGLVVTGTRPLTIGSEGFGWYFNGLVDELSLYSRALSADEIRGVYNAGKGGKCLAPVLPFIFLQPASQIVTRGGNVNFTIGVSGNSPFNYQWTFNGNRISDATNSTLNLTNVNMNQAGVYAVLVTNVAGWVLSSNADLIVNFPPATLRILDTPASALQTATVSITLAANGNENALAFSLDFDPTLLTYRGMTAGAGAPGAGWLINDEQAGSGRVGILLSLPAGTSFVPGTQEVVRASFTAAVVVNDTPTPICFGDVPIDRLLTDAAIHPLAATYIGGTVDIAAANFEGDVWPPPDGDRTVNLGDWVQIGRYVAGLDFPTNVGGFQRADCAPRASLGDGAITVIDWVQAGRYAARLDAPTVAGGPTGPTGVPTRSFTSKDDSRELRVADAQIAQKQTASLSVTLNALGNENALGFSVLFATNELAYQGLDIGSAGARAQINVNAQQTAMGILGLALALPAGASFPTGLCQLVKLNFQAKANATGTSSVALMDAPVVRQVSDADANALPTSYVNGTVTINSPPTLIIERTDELIVLSWPLWATNSELQALEGLPLLSAPWTNVTTSVIVSNNANTVTLPLGEGVKFYRLRLR